MYSLQGYDEVSCRQLGALVFSGALSRMCFMYSTSFYTLIWEVSAFLQATIGSLSLALIGPTTVLQIILCTRGLHLHPFRKMLICWCCVWLSVPCGFDLVPRITHPAWVVRERLTFLPLQARLHLTPPLPNYYGCVNTWRPVSSGSSYLPWQTGTLDRLWPLLNTILITASVSSNYLTCAPFNHMNCGPPRPCPRMLLDGVVESGLTQLDGSHTDPEAQAEQPGHDRTHLLRTGRAEQPKKWVYKYLNRMA